MSSKVWNEITYPFQNFKGCKVLLTYSLTRRWVSSVFAYWDFYKVLKNHIFENLKWQVEKLYETGSLQLACLGSMNNIMPCQGLTGDLLQQNSNEQTLCPIVLVI